MSTIAINHTVRTTPRSAGRAPHGQLRLTRRGRAVVIAFGVIVVLALGMFLGAGSVASRFAGPTETTVIKVEPGQTLWGIAAEVTDSGDDVRDTMYDIQRMNAMTSSTLQAGQKLRVPLAD